jgi:hypothetical protein
LGHTLTVEAEVNVETIAATLPRVKPGDLVDAVSTTGTLRRVAVTNVVRGHRFPVVWVCAVEEWEQANLEEREPDAVPWPAEDVEPVDG